MSVRRNWPSTKTSIQVIKIRKTLPRFHLQSFLIRLEHEDRSNPRGIVPIWRARSITEFKPELLPPPPVPLPVKDSLDSLIDIIDYLQQQYAVKGYTHGEEEEGTNIVHARATEEENAEPPTNIN